ncbi:fucose permease [Crossiella equi]|uniref:Fucose permease n=1 Tax=Crossiella equi TaxID=130796 RepID=A0ABS5AQB5_9PSEU|nr:hypothetical protein [Crossiella equi]MBP2478626.1 fucose permease [Crossiella equi]
MTAAELTRRPVFREPPATVGAGLLLALLLGVVTAGLGAAVPLFGARFGVEASGVVTAYNLGALASILGCAFGSRRPTWVRVAVVLFPVSCLVLALAPSWPVVLGGAAGAGAAFGVLVLHLNVEFGHPGQPRPLLALNLVHACFGTGAVLGPAAIALTGGAGLPLLAAAVLALACLGTRAGIATAAPVEASAARRGVLAVAAVAALLYSGAEAGLGAFASTHLVRLGEGPEAAAGWTALFWAGLALGRLLLPGFTERLDRPRLLLGALLAGTALLLATLAATGVPLLYGLVGLALALVFPTLTVWAVSLTGTPERTNQVLLVANLAGSAAVPAAVGQLSTVDSPAVFPLALGAVLFGTAVAVFALTRTSRLEAEPVR